MLRFSNDHDKYLLRLEIERLKARGFSFQGETEEKQLGADRWILAVRAVEDKTKKGGKPCEK